MKLIPPKLASVQDGGLDDLAREAAQNDASPQAPEPAPDDGSAAAMAQIEAGTAKIMLGLLKAARAWLARKLPEIKEEWPDDLLKGPADAAVPLVKKHLEALMQIAGANPELAVFAMSLLPLVLGYVAATEKHDKRTVQEVKTPASDAAT